MVAKLIKNNSLMRVIIDLDDTICKTINRDYEHSLPVAPVVAKLRQLRQRFPEAEVILHTARGMNSCKGNVVLAEKKNRPTIERWLRRYDISVDSIIFGKPLGDLYIDDKAMSAHDFANAEIERFEGLSGATVERIGDMVIKTADNVEEQAKWYEQAKQYGYDVPSTFCVQLGKLYMEYIAGKPAYKTVDKEMIAELCRIIKHAPELDGENDLKGYTEYVEERAKSAPVAIGRLSDVIINDYSLRKRTFCHGDFSLLNVIQDRSRLVLIDPSPKRSISHWAIDAAKLRASLRWLDYGLVGEGHPLELCRYFDSLYTGEELATIKLLEKSHFFRVYAYAERLHKRDVAERLITRYKEMNHGQE